jgi:hypothetical protein
MEPGNLTEPLFHPASLFSLNRRMVKPQSNLGEQAHQ